MDHLSLALIVRKIRSLPDDFRGQVTFHFGGEEMDQAADHLVTHMLKNLRDPKNHD